MRPARDLSTERYRRKIEGFSWLSAFLQHDLLSSDKL